MKTAFIAFAMAVAVSSAFATYCEPHPIGSSAPVPGATNWFQKKKTP